jgi:hypothetical protein
MLTSEELADWSIHRLLNDIIYLAWIVWNSTQGEIMIL